MPSKKREASCSSQHGDAIGCPLSPYCKFEINLTLFAIWLVAIKFTPTIAWWISRYNYTYFIATSQIANNLGLLSNLQYRLSERPIASPCCEEELASLFSDSTAAQTTEFGVFIDVVDFIATSQIANNLGLLSNLQHRLSGHPIVSRCCEEELAPLFSNDKAAQT